MNKSNIEAGQAGTKDQQSTTVDNQQVSQPNANTNVVGSHFKSREIKFRVFNGIEMIYDVMAGKFGNFFVNPSNNGISEKDSACLSEFNTKYPDSIPLMQFTGLKDKNGKEIYEGDIVVSYKKPYEDSPSTNLVVFIDGGFKLKCAGKNDIPLFLYAPKYLEAIGNIFENP